MRADWDKNSLEFQMFGDIYKFFKDFGVPENNDEYIRKLLEAQHEVYRKYDGTTLSRPCVRVLVALTDHLLFDMPQMQLGGGGSEK